MFIDWFSRDMAMYNKNIMATIDENIPELSDLIAI
jgi:hypothetical protein